MQIFDLLLRCHVVLVLFHSWLNEIHTEEHDKFLTYIPVIYISCCQVLFIIVSLLLENLNVRSI